MYALKLSRRYLVVMASAIFLYIPGAWSAPPDLRDSPLLDHRQAMIERHSRMAELHSQMSKCLDSGKSFEICHDEMLKNCQISFGEDCPAVRKYHMRGSWYDGCWNWKSSKGATEGAVKKSPGSK